MLLETVSTEERLQKVLQILSRRIEVLRLSHEIGERTKEQLEDRERKFLLREQLKTIQKELGETEEDDPEIAKLSEAIDKVGMPDEVEAQARKELQRLQRMPPRRANIHAAYLSRVDDRAALRLPRNTHDLDAARHILETDHFGLERVKQRIIEFLAVQKLKPQGRAPILCFVGPPES
jgi:ATP-dependent Lon protease